MMRFLSALTLGLWLAGALGAEAGEGDTGAAIRDRGYLLCGVGSDDLGFATLRYDGEWTGFDVDFCRAVAAAMLGDATAVEFVPLDSLNRLEVLARGEVDVLFRTTTFTFDRDVNAALEFPAITFYDSQKVLVYADTGARTLADLAGKTVCANSGTTSITNIRHRIDSLGGGIGIQEYASQAGRWRAFFGRECEAVTADGSDLAAMLASRPGYRDDFVLLEDEIANEPLGPVVREDDRQWEQIVRWVINLTLVAEAAGIGQTSGPAEIARLPLPAGADLGVAGTWGADVIRQVGNYDDIFSRNLGDGSELRMARGRNALWTDGGLMYPLPMTPP
ncbi:amino acid ABC transporter, periplasmic amino acid-binding protein [Rhodobacterales bacterium Y4I]|nr:amino acid ABC transporter, periplasmic amino acid-binding protein [Rhodobacterales bacterium Y4I]